MKLTAIILTGLVLCSSVVCAQEEKNEFSIDAQLRARGEYRNGVLSPRADGQLPVFFINNRARFSLGYKRDRLQMKLSAQHVGVWGQDPQIDKNGRFILHEAWAKLDLGERCLRTVGTPVIGI